MDKLEKFFSGLDVEMRKLWNRLDDYDKFWLLLIPQLILILLLGFLAGYLNAILAS